MKITTKPELDLTADLIIIGFFEEDANHSKPFPELASELSGAIKQKLFSKKFGEIYSTKLKDKKLLVLGLGKKKELDAEKIRRLFGKAVSGTKSAKLESFSSNLAEKLKGNAPVNETDLGRSAAEGLLLSNYNFTKYLSKEKLENKKAVTEAILQWTAVPKLFQEGLGVGRIIAEATNFTRDLVNEPANVVNSVYLENAAKKIAAKHPSQLQLKVLNQAELEKLGMNALLGVNAGSANPAKLLILEYKGSSGKPVALVGKGVTFDSGGYNLKPTKYIEEMKDDMSGAGAVLGTIKAAAELGLKKHLIGVMPLCENMVNGAAQKPGDIVKAYNGKTIEIGNTDAEGRLILADALAYVEDKYQPEIIIDLATLTGACIVALGYYSAGLMGKDEKLLEEIKTAGEDSGDRAWILPFYED
ncbi:MAG TPA: leucyl aminopeptidase, partial [Candidatus Nanoarchaeia archaeon]|nr:leucyl aminopeptidase [Candidatus Nanoarchaeia archaeon]